MTILFQERRENKTGLVMVQLITATSRIFEASKSFLKISIRNYEKN